MAWIKTIEPEEAAGDLKVGYDKAVRRAGKLFNIVKLQSLNPRTLRASMDLYLARSSHQLFWTPFESTEGVGYDLAVSLVR